MAESPTQLDAVETTVSPNQFDSYRTYRSQSCLEELEATKELYSKIDDVEGKSKTQGLMDCRKFAWFARHIETNRVHVVSNSCRLRWCPICSKGRTGYIVQSLTPWMMKKRVTRFLTLTMRHSQDDLHTQITRLYSYFRTLRRHKWFRKHVSGGVWFFQVKLGVKRDAWHPHLHCIVSGKYIPKMELSRLWEKITCGSKIVDVKMVRVPKDTASYVARYSARPAQLRKYPLDLRIEIYSAMHGRRLCGSWGAAKGVSLRPPTSVESTKFVRLGSWSQVEHLRHSDIDARTIFECWYEKETIDPSVSLDYIDRLLNDMPDITFEGYTHDLDPQFEFS